MNNVTDLKSDCTFGNDEKELLDSFKNLPDEVQGEILSYFKSLADDKLKNVSIENSAD